MHVSRFNHVWHLDNKLNENLLYIKKNIYKKVEACIPSTLATPCFSQLLTYVSTACNIPMSVSKLFSYSKDEIFG